jgi:LuxR family transcriptional regulator, maltose regulon positive regulatory protein
MLLSAPAGAGKTVLLSSWIAARELPGPACWLTLDGDDNDPSRLLCDLLSALNSDGLFEPGSTLAELTPQLRGDHERTLALLANGLAELREPVVLVLDEIHALTSPPATSTLDFLVRHAPEQLRLLLAGRADPPLPIERLHVAGALSELRVADLAFDRTETAALCRQLQLQLTDAELDTLWQRTEGWPAALRLAAFSLQGHPRPAEFLAEFAGTDRAIADYLVSEVLVHLPNDLREFMLRTCLVDPVYPELADALIADRVDTSVADAATTLAALERMGAPVQPTQQDGYPYRYHPLFGELLRAHLHHAHPHEVPLLHRRAARWYAEQGEITSAVRHALAGEDRGQAQALVMLAAVALQDARLRAHADDAERFARELMVTARACSHRCWLSLRSFALSNLGAVRLWTGEREAAVRDLEEGLALASEQGKEQITLDCLAQLATVHILRGEWTRSEELASQAVALAERHHWDAGSAPACAYLAAAAATYRRGEFERAEETAGIAAAAAATAEAPVRLATGILQALALAAAGPRSATRGVLKLRAIRAEAADGEALPDFLREALDEAEPRVLIAAGEIEQARALLEQARARAPERPELLVRHAALELTIGNTEQAAALLAQIPAEQADDVDLAVVIESWLLRARVAHTAGRERDASQALDRALALAEREPLRDVFLLSGPAVAELLERQARNGTAHPALLEVLLDGVGEDRTVRASTTLFEPLTEREQSILRYLPTMLSNAEIGAEVYVSLNTVKTHLRSIYRKLDASGRADAVERGRELGLLPAGIKRPRVVQRV